MTDSTTPDLYPGLPGVALTARHADLPDLVEILRGQHAAKLDVVAPARDVHAEGGLLVVRGATEPRLTVDGVTAGDVWLRPTALADAQIADKLTIPITYLRRLRERKLDLYDANVNTWLADEPGRRFLARALVSDPAAGGDGGGVLRALLSDSFKIVDNLDELMSALQGIRDAGAAVDITAADLTDARMYVKVRSREVAELAPELLRDYVSPFTGNRGADNPLVFAGFVISNSEVGHGSFSIAPQLTVQVCDNGMTLTRHVLREVHLGGRLRDGVIAWRDDTQAAALELVIKQTRDAVTAFLDRDFLRARLAEWPPPTPPDPNRARCRSRRGVQSDGRGAVTTELAAQDLRCAASTDRPEVSTPRVERASMNSADPSP